MTVTNPYQYLPPSESSTLASLENIWGDLEAREEWYRVCNTLGYPKPGPALTMEQLGIVADHLIDQGDILMVAGFSLKTRLKTWDALSRLKR